MEEYDETDQIQPTSPQLVAIQPKLSPDFLGWDSSDEWASEEEIDVVSYGVATTMYSIAVKAH
jgi:hypothetical protein